MRIPGRPANKPGSALSSPKKPDTIVSSGLAFKTKVKVVINKIKIFDIIFIRKYCYNPCFIKSLQVSVKSIIIKKKKVGVPMRFFLGTPTLGKYIGDYRNPNKLVRDRSKPDRSKLT